MSAVIGTFETPLAANATKCPRCEEDTLRVMSEGLLEAVLMAMLDDDLRDELGRRVEVRCWTCGWAGSAWRAEP